jgi:hypothetical protein
MDFFRRFQARILLIQGGAAGAGNALFVGKKHQDLRTVSV